MYYDHKVKTPRGNTDLVMKTPFYYGWRTDLEIFTA